MSHGDALHPMPSAPPQRSRYEDVDNQTVERLIDELEPPDTMVLKDGSKIDLRAPWKLPT